MEEQRVTPHPCHASHLAVASTDPLSFVVSLMLVVIVLGALVIFIDSKMTGFEPKESWAEVSAGVLLITLGILAVVHYRTRSINRILASAHWRKARLEKFRTASQWTILRVAYEMNGKMTEKGVWLANSRRSRALGKLEEVTLALDPASLRRFVITNLYC
jgi:cytochrome c biogenesis protein CcdA